MKKLFHNHNGKKVLAAMQSDQRWDQNTIGSIQMSKCPHPSLERTSKRTMVYLQSLCLIEIALVPKESIWKQKQKWRGNQRDFRPSFRVFEFSKRFEKEKEKATRQVDAFPVTVDRITFRVDVTTIGYVGYVRYVGFVKLLGYAR